MPLFEEFLSENAHRYYPFAPISDVNAVPTALILDFGIIATTNVPANTGADTLYISKVVTDGTHIRFYLAMDVAGAVTDFGCIATVAVSTTVGERTTFKYADNGVIFEGFIVTGDTTVATTMPPSTPLDKDSGRIYTGCIQHMSQWLAGINVNGQTLSGVIDITTGNGVTASVDGNSVTFSCVGADIPIPNTAIVSDTKLADELVAAYGAPITSINGTSKGGAWYIATREVDGLSITTGDGEIQLNNQAAKACCTAQDINNLVDNIAELNLRVGTIQDFLAQLETNQNLISVQMTRLL